MLTALMIVLAVCLSAGAAYLIIAMVWSIMDEIENRGGM